MLTGGKRAAVVGISSEAGSAVADGVVVGDAASSILAAETSTWVNTFQVDAC